MRQYRAHFGRVGDCGLPRNLVRAPRVDQLRILVFSSRSAIARVGPRTPINIDLVSSDDDRPLE